jgi:predicted ABC-type ATPase
MNPTLCILGGCNGAGKSTLARELLPLLGIHRFLNADEIARGLSPIDPSLAAFKAGRLLIEEARDLIASGSSFAIESTLSGRTYLSMIREAKKRGIPLRPALHHD